MRLIATITDLERENPEAFSYYLTAQGIPNEIEETPQGVLIWVREEDHVQKATQFYQEYHSDPNHSRYAVKELPIVDMPLFEENDSEEPEEPPKKRKSALSPAPYGPISVVILFTVITLFMWAQMQRGAMLPPKIPGVIQAPLLAPLEKRLLFDYPAYFSLRDTLLKVYPTEENQAPPPEAKALIQEIRTTPVWMGIYDRFIAHYRNSNAPLIYNGPLFEKISQGEVWRLFTPALLHYDLLHIFFNIIWFILLGNQIEFRLGPWRYLFLIVVTGVLSNTAQYLMSGPFFMGLSGIVVGMAAFIWARQQKAPWEGYLLHRFTLIFLAIFVIGVFLLQLGFFILQLLGKYESSISIANTAHLVGGAVGYFLGRLRYFATHPKSSRK